MLCKYVIVELSNAFLWCSNGKKTKNDCSNKKKIRFVTMHKEANQSYGHV